jgi:hypothetical protein
MSDKDKNSEILVLRHQLTILQRQIDKPRLTTTDRAFLAVLLHRLPRTRLRQLHLIVSPGTILRWHRDLIRRRHTNASRSKRPGRPPTRRAIQTLVLRLARENSSWGLSANPWGAGHTRNHTRTLHRVGNPQGSPDRPIARPRSRQLGRFPPQSSQCHRGLRLLHRRHAQRCDILRLRRHRARQSPRPHPWCYRTPERRVDLGQRQR